MRHAHDTVQQLHVQMVGRRITLHRPKLSNAFLTRRAQSYVAVARSTSADVGWVRAAPPSHVPTYWCSCFDAAGLLCHRFLVTRPGYPVAHLATKSLCRGAVAAELNRRPKGQQNQRAKIAQNFAVSTRPAAAGLTFTKQQLLGSQLNQLGKQKPGVHFFGLASYAPGSADSAPQLLQCRQSA